MSGEWRWRAVLTQRQRASRRSPSTRGTSSSGAYLPFALNVLSLRGELVSDVTAFIVRATDNPDLADYRNYPHQPMDDHQLTVAFGRFGLAHRLN